ncbi:hypothetical protein [Chimaeribacter arupi]|uniref:hypothetical protein n=1 Tax=Chimaeribacter arupi TaxID=2060066 RepID=UPI000C797BAD|nr:hypothetical protein [Chimaeribacter arupi]PLR29591.1 hypothetical protein CYR23_19965 [Chimaeribacter arupi]
MPQHYTNALTPALVASINEPVFTAAQRAEMNDDARALIATQEAFHRAHPVTAIYRLAVAGSLTRRGGVADEFNPDPEQGYKIRLEHGQWVSVLTEGCTVTYPDGSSARIISSAGSLHAYQDRGVALVGSRLDNGDEIISTPQGSCYLIAQQGVPMPDDFLRVTGA